MFAAILRRETAVIALVVAILTGSPAQAQTDFPGDPERGRSVAEARCASCHGADGNSADPRYPKLAGQNAAYLYGQLRAFKAGARRSDVMSAIVAALSDADFADASSFFAQQTIRSDPVKDEALASAGERIFLGGAGNGIPACAMCHGATGRGGMPMMGMMRHGMMGGMPMAGMMGNGMMNAPNLNGQHAAYLSDQLTRFATGERQGMMMNHIAAALSEFDKKAVAAYLSGLP